VTHFLRSLGRELLAVTGARCLISWWVQLGYPRLLRFIPCMSEETFKRVEPFLVIGTGIGLLALNQILGGFLLLSGIGWIVSNAATEIAIGERIGAMHDQLIEQQYLTERFRRLSGK